MGTVVVINRWARSIFGNQVARLLGERLPQALQAGIERKQEAQRAAETRTLHPYGGTWLAMFEELISHTHDLPDVEILKVSERSFELPILNGVVIFPYRYGKDAGASLNTHKHAHEVWRRLTPAISTPVLDFHPTLDGIGMSVGIAGGEDADIADTVDTGIRKVVVLGYAENYEGGLLKVEWRELATHAGQPVWGKGSALALPSDRPLENFGHITSREDRSHVERQRFDQTPEVSPQLRLRNVPSDGFVASEEPSQDRIADEG